MKLKKLLSATLLIAGLLNFKTASAQTWDLLGNSNLTATSKLGGSSATAAQNFPLRLFTYNAERIHINANVAGRVGYVGIGNTAPATMLHVNGVITSSGGTSTAWNTAVTRVPTGTTSKVPRWNGTAYIAGSIFDNGTNIGIGTTTPTAALQVQKSTLANVLITSSGNGSQLSLDRSANGFEAVTRYTQTGVPQWKIGLMVNGNGSPDYLIKNEINNSNALVINAGTNSLNLPAGSLSLGSTDASFISKSGVDLNLNAYSPTNFSGFTPGNVTMATAGFGFKVGNVGIGTASPTLAKLQVEGSVGQSIAIFKKSASSAGIAITADWPEIYFNSYYLNGVKAMKAGYGGLIGVDPTSGNMYFRTGSAAAVNNNDPLSFSDNMVIDRLGNVGIGTFPATYKLNVCGTMRATEVRVSTGWCDYVFADDYKLPSLNDVEIFIKANKHLPDVTPGAIIESEGLEIGKTSSQMIKKIEELTLYVIDLQKQVNDLKSSK